MLVFAMVTSHSRAAERCRAAGNNRPPRLGLRRGEGVPFQIRGTKLAQRIGQRCHLARGWLEDRQSCQQVERVSGLWSGELWTDQVQIAAGGADITMAEQFLNGE